MFFWKKISPANGYCLFFPKRRVGAKFVSGQSVRVGPLEEWKHVKLGLFNVVLPGQEELLTTTSEQLTCGIRASFGIVVGGPEEGREDRLAKATISCPATRSLDSKDRVELTPFFQDWAKNYCRTAIINTLKRCEYIRLIEESKYREEAERNIEKFAKDTLETIGMLLVQCTVVVEPNEPSGVFATPEMLSKWENYRKAVSIAELSKLKAENADKEEKAIANAEHETLNQRLEEGKKQTEAAIKQETEIKLRELALELKRKEALLAIEEQQEMSNKDSRISAIQEEIARRAQEAQLHRIRREAELDQERELKAKELADLKRQRETEALAHRLSLLAEERLVAEKELQVMTLKEQLNAVQVELDRSSGDVKSVNVEKEVLAKGAQEAKMRQLLLSGLTAIVEQASQPVAKIGEIRAISLSGSQGPETNGQSSLGSILASASTLPIVRELFRFVNDIEADDGRSRAAFRDSTTSN